MAWDIVRNMIGDPHLQVRASTSLDFHLLTWDLGAQESLWRTVRTCSSMCSGVFTAEMALAHACNVVNKSGCFNFRAQCRSLAAWVSVSEIWLVEEG